MLKQGACVLILGLTEERDVKVLMTQRRDGSGWTLPGGKIEAGERAIQAAARECFEETGHLYPPDDLRHLYSGVEIDGWITNCFYLPSKHYGVKAGEVQQLDGEAPFKWGIWDELFDGPFGEFCRTVFKVASS